MGRTQVESRVETLPYSWYADPAVAAAERERIFRRSWQYAGHIGELTGRGACSPRRSAACRWSWSSTATASCAPS